MTALLPAITDWKQAAACRGIDTDFFFPERGDRLKDIREVCARCPVTEPCLELGMSEKFGVFGGKSERERRSLRRQRGIPEPKVLDDDELALRIVGLLERVSVMRDQAARITIIGTEAAAS